MLASYTGHKFVGMMMTSMTMREMVSKTTLMQELCSNGDLRNHLKSFDFVKTMTQVITVMQKWQEVMMTMVMLQRTKNKEKLGDIVDDSE